MLAFLVRLLQRIRPREGWFRYLTTLMLLACAPLALWEVNSQWGAQRLLLLALVAGMAGVGIAKSRMGAGWAALLHLALGGGLVLQVVGRILPPVPLWVQDAQRAIEWLRLLGRGVLSEPYPFASVAAAIWRQMDALVSRVGAWGLESGDMLVVTLLAGLLAWGVAASSTWWLYRSRQPLAGVLLPGAAAAEVVFFSGRGGFWLLLFVASTLAWLAAFQAHEAEQRWQTSNIDYPTDIRLDQVLVVALIIVGLLITGMAVPVVRLRPITRALWTQLDEPWQAVEGASRRLMGLPEATARADALGLPNAQLIGAGPELEDTLVLRVRTDDPIPAAGEEGPPRRYWRGATYDVYTGSGWASSPTTVRTLLAEQPLDQYPADRPTLVQRFEQLAPPGGALYAANAPERFDQAVTVRERAPGDLAHVTGRLEQYTVVSRPPAPTRAQLRAASVNLPEGWERLLELPESVPDRVRDLAGEVVSGAESPFDRAMRVEEFLRTYTYTLDLPAPPTDVDVADYFLFELQQGYCDYYATAMAVMARAVGLPARLATGFVQGTLDRDSGSYLVTEAEAHSWVEVYFEGVGWVEFEPTAGRPGLTRPAGAPEEAPPAPLPIPARPAVRAPRVGLWIWIAGLAVIAVGAWVALQSRLRSRTPLGMVVDRFQRLLQWGARLDRPLEDGKTPKEYAADLGAWLASRAGRSRLGRVRVQAQGFRREVETLGDAFTQARYAPHPVSVQDARRIGRLWERLRRWLWLLWLGGQRRPPDPAD